MAAFHRLVIEQGATFEERYEIVNDEAVWPIPATWQARAQVRAEPLALAVILDLTEHLAVDHDAGTITLRIPATTTAALDRGGVWDLELYDPGDVDQVYRLLAGTVEVEPEVTR
ncbi:hypothetical protein [Streptosporangium sp. NPDC049078]|uniref:LtfC-like domain-containing protein n=1 Tax=Streptosporangium sp. NPDC049078 TaxID=3155767 RepID=UPI0034287B47